MCLHCGITTTVASVGAGRVRASPAAVIRPRCLSYFGLRARRGVYIPVLRTWRKTYERRTRVRTPPLAVRGADWALSPSWRHLARWHTRCRQDVEHWQNWSSAHYRVACHGRGMPSCSAACVRHLLTRIYSWSFMVTGKLDILLA